MGLATSLVWRRKHSVWVGAPGSGEFGRRIRIHERINRGPGRPSTDFERSRHVEFVFGASLAATANLVVVGAPGADGGRGRAAVFEATAGWVG